MECRQEAVEAPLYIVWMHAFDPSGAYFLLHASACKFEPRFVEIIAKAIRSGHPNQHRRGIGHYLEPRLAFPQPLFSMLLLGNVPVYRIIRNLLAGSRSNWNCDNGDTNMAPVFAPANGFDLHSMTLFELMCIFSCARNKRLGNDEVVDGTFENLLLLVTEHTREFLVDAKNAVVQAE